MRGPDTNSLQTRHSLLTRLKDWNDQDSWRRFFDTYWRLIYNVALKAGLYREEAEEVVQETVISVAKNIAAFRCDPAAGSFKAWLLRLTRWRIADQFRKRSPWSQNPPPADTRTSGTALVEKVPDPGGLCPDAIWDAEWEQNLLEAATDRVKNQIVPEMYQIYQLYVVEQLPVKQVAASMGVSVGQVYLTKHRVLRLIKREVAKLKGRPL